MALLHKYDGRVMKTYLLAMQNRELQVMRQLGHCNVVSLLNFFYTTGEVCIKISPNMCVRKLLFKSERDLGLFACGYRCSCSSQCLPLVTT